MTPEDLLNTLEDLGDEEFSKFKWFLQQPDSLQGFLSIRKRDLETADRLKTVDLMVQTYRLPGAVEVTRKLLEKINRNDLVQSLSDRSISDNQKHLLQYRTTKVLMMSHLWLVGPLPQK
uniref:Pyrin domain-containing protein n=1 Tax=Lates calcarifer TaxID=8187 RepID=A0A4W6E340_LATCA